MASNRELSERAETLGKELSVPVETKGLNNQALTDLVADLERRAEQAQPAPKAAAPEPAAAPKAPEPPAPAPSKPARPPINGAGGDNQGGPPKREPPKAPRARAPFVVAPKKSLACRRGILGPGEEIKSSDVEDGQAGLERLVRGGYVVRTEGR